ncbi:glycoside hydrolase family 78 protein [Daldinia vernicosa]|uniref:glycoside hydrolase family 78 protein n=1 Tax=Daldinia vernicosa TaxID=114800 RepID=UPI002008C4FF|nr:glycoside hydrolase family 78 protein [Daldinia vernicosa]KAI0844606.1 glycoside hydrolase family 78 protein [Daldinia vernicosa]
MAVAISQVSFEHHRVALGIGEDSPRISWRFEGQEQDWRQGGYSIELSRHKQNQTGLSQIELFHHNSSDSVLVPWPTVLLASAESATVRVRAYGEGDHPDTPWSDKVNVETGLLDRDDWSGARMISADKETEKNATHQPLLFRKEFSVNSTSVEKARLYITAYGLYEAQINGKRVGTNVLAPGWQSYKHRLVYDTYDVTDLLLAGDNVLGITVGEGWYAGRLGFGAGNRNIWGDTLGAMALLVTTSNGKTRSIKTDKSWTSSTGPIVTSEIYNGEVYDSRLEQTGWSTPGFLVPDTAKWIAVKELETPYGILAAPDGPPIQRIEEIKLREILTSPTGKTILDFGQNFAGWLRIAVKGKRGETIKLVHTEVLEDGEVATRPLRNATQTDYLTLSGELQTWEPSFTYHGFRYVMVDGWPEDDTPLNSDSMSAIVLHSNMEETGAFECSDELLNKLHANVRWSMKSNFMSIPSDCPQRDERLGWTGDSLAFAPTANFLYDTSGFWRGWLKDLQSEQVKAIWGDALVANPFNTYRASGDLDTLREQYTGAKAWLDEGIPRNEAGLWSRSNFQLGDWLDPKSPPDDPGRATTSSTYVADAYLVYVTGLVAEMASELGLDDDKIRFEKWAEDLKTAFGEAWIGPQGIVANETQTGLALPLYFDLFDSEAQANAAASRLEKIIVDNKYLVGTGFSGTHLLGLALTKYNLTDTFYKMLSQTAVPSWLYQVTMGATTTWERWDSLLPDGSLNPGEMLSFNHYSFGSVANWIHQVISGLAPARPGWKTARVNIEPGGNITWAKASYLSPYGKISTDWKINDTGFHLVLEVPPNTDAEVVLPGEKRTLLVGSGRHRISDPTFHF